MAGAKVGGHDICALVYFHSIVFCLDFHQGEPYLRKRGRKWDENKGRGREPSVMEPVPHWCSFSQRHVDMAPPLLLMCLLIHWALFRYSRHFKLKLKQQQQCTNTQTHTKISEWSGEGGDVTCFLLSSQLLALSLKIGGWMDLRGGGGAFIKTITVKREEEKSNGEGT